MRETTLLLMDGCNIISHLAELIESYLIGDLSYVEEESDEVESWMYVGIGGHMELIYDGIARDARDGIDECNRSEDIMNGACISGDMEVIDMIIAAGVKEFTAGLTGAVGAGHLHIAQKMIDLGADATNPLLMTAATINNNVAMCKILVDAGCDARETIIDAVGRYGDLTYMTLLERNSLVPKELSHILVTACKSDQLGFVKRCWPSGNPDAAGIATILAQHSVLPGGKRMIEFLLSKGADPNAVISDACEYGYADIIELLIRAGATHCKCGWPIDGHTRDYIKMRREVLESRIIERCVAIDTDRETDMNIDDS